MNKLMHKIKENKYIYKVYIVLLVGNYIIISLELFYVTCICYYYSQQSDKAIDIHTDILHSFYNLNLFN